MQRDPLGYVDGMNLMEYVRSNPVNWVDPMGREKCEEGEIGDERNHKLNGVSKTLPGITPLELKKIKKGTKKLAGLTKILTKKVPFKPTGYFKALATLLEKSPDIANSLFQSPQGYKLWILLEYETLEEVETGFLFWKCKKKKWVKRLRAYEVKPYWYDTWHKDLQKFTDL